MFPRIHMVFLNISFEDIYYWVAQWWGLGRIFCQRDWLLTWPHQGAILENNVSFQICNGPFQISNGPQLWLIKLRASLCIDKYHFLDLYGLCNMKKQIVKPIIVTLWLTHLFLISHVASHHQFLIIELILHPRLQHEIYTTA